MSSSSNDQYKRESRGFLTPPPTWKTTRRFKSPPIPCSERRPRLLHNKVVPSGDSPYVRAKHAQLIDKDPSRAVPLFWAAINSGDRVESALKDMAVVLKQFDRSDEAIEAIKSFRHICSLESQPSIDNILLDLYKISGRFQELIEMLQLKVKQVEEGMAFGGNRTKTARSKGRKVQITVEKEYSRLLGHLAWAYMQHQDFKSAEENYRKSLSFESDKNKQCNLALCLMHMNRLTEAKFLLQAIRTSDNGQIDESYAKSYERASQTLADLESKHAALKPMKPAEYNTGFCFQQNCAGFQSTPVPHFLDKMKKGAFTEFPSEKKTAFNRNSQENADYAHNRAYDSPHCSKGILKVPFTQPRPCSWSFGNRDQRRSEESGYGGFNQKLTFVHSIEGEIVPSSASSKVHLPSPRRDWRKKSVDNMQNPNKEPDQLLENKEKGKLFEFSTSQSKKSWADMVEEELENWRSEIPQSYSDKFSICSTNSEGCNDENVDFNIISGTPQVEKLSQKIEPFDLECDYNTQPGKNNQTARRSLCFDQNREGNQCNSPLLKKAFNF